MLWGLFEMVLGDKDVVEGSDGVVKDGEWCEFCVYNLLYFDLLIKRL